MNVKPDEIWKVAIRKLLPSFIEFFYPQYYHQIDWTKEVHFLDKELETIQPNSRPKNRIADMLVMLHRKRGKLLCIFLHFEIQGYFDRLFSHRVHQMNYRIEDKFGVQPAILCIYTDDNPNFHPKEYYKRTWGTSSRTIFNTYKVMNNPPSKYKMPDSIASIIMETVYQTTQLKGKTDNEVMNMFMPLVRKLFTKGYNKEETKIALSFIETGIKFGNSDSYRIFEENIDNMVKFKSSEELVADFFDTEKNLRLFKIEEKKWIAKSLRLEAKSQRLEAKIELDLQEMERMSQEKERAYQEKERAYQEKERAYQEKERAYQEKERERQEKERAYQEKERERQEKERGVLLMLNQGISIELIARVLGVSEKEIEEIEEKYKDENPILDILKK